ncbi:probable methyltransferase PMT19 [Phragmites australis]|uniref:probable methyltransferase PMT19 n=1 Tax=Phragmites australis TaxID=29695 RepID=UPI002D775D3D|nr:probable methyltransferase PMT19 [Phragmites australis]XP_062228600.1 probable methyltransferase PMT19 [Phragmites australis]
MRLSLPSPDAVIAALPRALAVAAAAVAAATTSLLLISVAVSRSHVHSSSPPPPSTSASTTAALPPSPGPSPLPDSEHPHPHAPPVPPCPPNATHLVPCHDPPSGDRHCPPRPPPPPLPPKEPPPHPPPPPPHCHVPPPPGYHPPPPWPARRERARYANVELPLLPAAKVAAGQDPVRAHGEWLVFPKGVRNYVELLESVVPLRGGVVRTALDVGCGVANFGDYLLNYGILTMSIAPRNRQGAQVQLALERGLPAMIGGISAHRLPYPSRSFDMVHCADCLVPWTAHDGLYMLEIDRLLQPGGYWVFSRSPISRKAPYNVSNQAVMDIQGKQLAMDDMAKKLRWMKLSENGTIAVWRKPTNHLHCDQEEKLLGSPPLCTGDDPDSAWYSNISMCITCLPRVEPANGCAGGAVEKWPKRLGAVPPRIVSVEMKWLSIQTYKHDSLIWEKRVNFYVTYLEYLSNGTYRNVMDMNAGFGGFAAALSKYPVWVMNVVPANITNNTLGIIYERGLIGTYIDWCEAFSTYPRTYDLIHANGIFSSHIHKCGIVDILVEMDRILRPGGAAIVRDRADVVLKVKKDADRLPWHNRIIDTENGALDPEKLLIVDKSLPLPGS